MPGANAYAPDRYGCEIAALYTSAGVSLGRRVALHVRRVRRVRGGVRGQAHQPLARPGHDG